MRGAYAQRPFVCLEEREVLGMPTRSEECIVPSGALVDEAGREGLDLTSENGLINNANHAYRAFSQPARPAPCAGCDHKRSADSSLGSFAGVELFVKISVLEPIFS